ncbi:MAG TPA: glycosyltransferase family 4 protein [Planctomycetaceae bacterium]|nr:glycosyltransferase family 4 protein [Planctomycetaceae bacterium]
MKQSAAAGRDAHAPRCVALVANTAWYLWNFRLNLARELRRRGTDVKLVCPPDEYVRQLTGEGFEHIEWNLLRRSMEPIGELRSLAALVRIYRRLRPQSVHHFTIKCVLYGTLAARLASVPSIVNSITGLGHLIVSDRRLIRLIRPLAIRAWCNALQAKNSVPVFQNEDDLRLLAGFRPELARRAVVTRGSGVDTRRFAPQPSARAPQATRTVLFVGRLLREKGVSELIEATRLIRARRADVRFVVCGAIDPGNPSSFTAADCAAWRREGLIELTGHVDDVEPLYHRADLIVLPSWREGVPRTLLEAGACAKAVVATDVPGCREVVVPGETGLLVPVRNPAALAAAIVELLDDPDRCQSMGMAARERIATHFDEDVIVRDTLNAYGLAKG